MSRLLFVLLLFYVFPLSAQQENVRLVGIQRSSEGFTVRKTWLSSVKITADTGYITLFGENDCQYHDPKVTLKDTTVFINIPRGILTPVYSVHGKFFLEEEMKAKGLAEYKDSAHFYSYTIKDAHCYCAFAFDLKITGLNPAVNYRYYYNGEPIDPAYIGPPKPIEFKFPYFLRVSRSKVLRKMKQIIKEEHLWDEFEFSRFQINFLADTTTGEILDVSSYFKGIDKTKSARQKAEKYFKSLPPIKLVKNPNKGNQLIEQYTLYFLLNERNRLKEVPESGQQLYDY